MSDFQVSFIKSAGVEDLRQTLSAYFAAQAYPVSPYLLENTMRDIQSLGDDALDISLAMVRKNGQCVRAVFMARGHEEGVILDDEPVRVIESSSRSLMVVHNNTIGDEQLKAGHAAYHVASQAVAYQTGITPRVI